MNRLLLTMLLLLSALPACAAGVGGMFGQGRTQFSLMGGNGYAFGNNYFVIGASVSHYVLDGLPDINSVGERAGINITAGPNAYASFGFVQEVYLNCQELVYQTCRETYPELGITFGF